MTDKSKKVALADVTEVKAMANPPQMVKNILSATLLLLGRPEPQTEWKFAQRFLADKNCVKVLKEFDAESCSIETANKAKQLLKDANVDGVRKVSAAAVSFYLWSMDVIERAGAGK